MGQLAGSLSALQASARIRVRCALVRARIQKHGSLALAKKADGVVHAIRDVDQSTTLRNERLLRIPDDYLPIGIAMVGHPAPDKKSGSLRRGRRKLDDVLHWESWHGSSNG